MYERALKLIRQYHRLNQIELAQKIGLSKSFLSELESGNKKVSIDVLEKYADFFRIPLSSLLLFAEKTHSNDFTERSRVLVADKVLKILQWIEDSKVEQKTQRRKK